MGRSLKHNLIVILTIIAVLPLIACTLLLARWHGLEEERKSSQSFNHQKNISAIVENYVSVSKSSIESLSTSPELIDFLMAPELTRSLISNRLYGKTRDLQKKLPEIENVYVLDKDRSVIFPEDSASIKLDVNRSVRSDNKNIYISHELKYDDQYLQSGHIQSNGYLVGIIPIKKLTEKIPEISSVSILESKEDGFKVEIELVKKTDATYGALPYLVIIAITLIILATIGFWLMYHRVLRPIENLTIEVLEKSEEDSGGSLNRNEIDILKDAFNGYVKTIQKQSTVMAIAQTTQILAHDVRKPFVQLKSLLDNIETISKDPKSLSSARDEVYSGIIGVDSMISEILDFSRDTKADTTAKSLREVLEFSIRQTAQSYKNKTISFSYDLKSEQMPFIDEVRISRAFTNIIGNAIEAITEIGEMSEGMVSFSSRDIIKDDKSFVEVTIANNGPSFKEEQIPLLFDTSFTSGKAAGTGLGLASVKKILEIHDGKIIAQNTDNGVEFVMYIPASDKKESLVTNSLPASISEIHFSKSKRYSVDVAEEAAVLAEKKHFKILLLEDEALYRIALKKTVEESPALAESVTILEATTVEDALAVLAQEDITHIISDIDLGQDLDGFDFLKYLQKSSYEIPCMVHSNRCSREDIEKVKSLGANFFVPKPAQLEAIVDFIADSYKEKKEVLNVFVADDSSLTLIALKHNITKACSETYELNLETFQFPEDLIARAAIVKPQIIISDNDFGDNSQMNASDLFEALKHVGAKKYICSNLPPEILNDIVESLSLDGSFDPSVSSSELKQILFKKQENPLLNFSKEKIDLLVKDMSKLFHDLITPIRSTRLLGDLAKNYLDNNNEDLDRLLHDGHESIRKSIERARKLIPEIAERHHEAAVLIKSVEGQFLPQLDYVASQIAQTNIWKESDALVNLSAKVKEQSRENMMFRNEVFGGLQSVGK